MKEIFLIRITQWQEIPTPQMVTVSYYHYCGEIVEFETYQKAIEKIQSFDKDYFYYFYSVEKFFKKHGTD